MPPLDTFDRLIYDQGGILADPGLHSELRIREAAVETALHAYLADYNSPAWRVILHFACPRLDVEQAERVMIELDTARNQLIDAREYVACHHGGQREVNDLEDAYQDIITKAARP
jgi:hypothetical protein